MLQIKMPDETIVNRVLEVGQIYNINKIAGHFIRAWSHWNFAHFDTFEVLEISRYCVEVVFRNATQEQNALITKLFFAKYLENCLTNSN